MTQDANPAKDHPDFLTVKIKTVALWVCLSSINIINFANMTN